MVELYIDSVACDLDAGYMPDKALFSLDAEADVEQQRSGRRLTLTLPASPRNDVILLHPADPLAAERFNSSYHHGYLKVDGVVMISGIVRLLRTEAVSIGRGGRCDNMLYHIELQQGGAEWAEMAARTPLHQTALEFETTLDADGIVASWQEQSLVKFLPVKRDTISDPDPEQGLFLPQRMMTVADYHPFVALTPLLEKIFTAGGYTLESEFLRSAEATRLHISGLYDGMGGSVERLRLSSGFVAGRTAEATATANEMGRVWLTPLVALSSLGNVVDTTEGGEFYNNGGALTIGEHGIEYHPKSKLTVGFEYYLKYTTDYAILSRERLQGFDAIMLDDGTNVEFPIANTFIDQKSSPQPNMDYLCVVFDHQVGNEYRLLYTTNSSWVQWQTFTSKTIHATLPMEAWETGIMLQYRVGGGSWREFTGDWAMYDGYVDEVGEIEVEVTIQTPPEEVSPSTGKSFTRAYLHGAKQGQKITLSKSCRLRPIFSPSPATGSRLCLKDVMAHEASQLELVQAVAHLYNLRIYTDEVARKVYVEPHEEFYTAECHDLSPHIDLGEQMQAEDMAFGQSCLQTLAYRSDAGGAVTRFNLKNEDEFGRWHYMADSYAAKQTTKQFVNPLFCPTLSAGKVVEGAPSAWLMQVGDSQSDALSEKCLRIVRYDGMRPLPEGERWGFPSFGREYPLAAFHLPEEFTLCFEDRDGAEGLHRYYDKQWRRESHRRTLRLTLSLPPHIVTALAWGDRPSETPTLRSLFRLAPSGEGAFYRLLAVESYDAASHKARCLFMRTENN